MEDKKEFHLKTSNWSDTIEKALLNIAESCKGYKWMNIFSAKRESFRYDILMYSLIILGPLSGILSSSSSSTSSSKDNILQIFVTVFSFSTGMFSAVIKYSKFDEKSLIYKTIASKYGSLESNIRRQLSLEKTDRVNAGEYLEWISNNYDSLFSSSPLISDDVYEKWKVINGGEKIEKKVEIVIEKKGDSISIKNEKEKHDKIPDDLYTDGKMKYELSRFYEKN